MTNFYELTRLESAKSALTQAAPLVTTVDLEPHQVKDILRNLANGVELLLKEFLARRHSLYVYDKINFDRLLVELDGESDAAERIDTEKLDRRTISGEEAIRRSASFSTCVRKRQRFLRDLLSLRNMVEHDSFRIAVSRFETARVRAYQFVREFLTGDIAVSLFDFLGGTEPADWSRRQVELWKEDAVGLVEHAKQEWSRLSTEQQAAACKDAEKNLKCEPSEGDVEWWCPACNSDCALRGNIEVGFSNGDPVGLFTHVSRLECFACGLRIEEEELLYALIGELDFDLQDDFYEDMLSDY